MDDTWAKEIAAFLNVHDTKFLNSFYVMTRKHPNLPKMSIAKALMALMARDFGPSTELDAAVMRLTKKEMWKDGQVVYWE